MAAKDFVIAGVLSLALAGAAHAAGAAQLSSVSGRVLIGRDGKLAPAAAGALKAGDRVIAADGAAQLTWADGCAVTLKAGAMITLSATSPCADGPALVTAGASSAQTAQEKPVTALQWGALGLSAAVMAAGLIGAADDLSVSN